MKRISLFLLLAIVCSGQMCAVPADTGSPAPDPARQMGIPAGVYSGQVTLQGTTTYIGLDGTYSQPFSPNTFTVTKQFGAHGGPLNGNSFPLSRGDSTADGGLVVESVFVDLGKAIVVNNTTDEYPDFGGLFGEPLHTSGIETITYTDLGGDRVRYESESHETSQVVDSQYVEFDSTTTGILSR